MNSQSKPASSGTGARTNSSSNLQQPLSTTRTNPHSIPSSSTPPTPTLTMSGGYNKFRCKFFYTYDCMEWVWLNGAACAQCMAKGRESVSAAKGPGFTEPGQIRVPVVLDGVMQYVARRDIVPKDPASAVPEDRTHSLPECANGPVPEGSTRRGVPPR